MKSYRANLPDVAKLVASTEGSGPNPEAICLLHWLIDQVPELRDLWKTSPLRGYRTLGLRDEAMCLLVELAHGFLGHGRGPPFSGKIVRAVRLSRVLKGAVKRRYTALRASTSGLECQRAGCVPLFRRATPK